LARTPAIGDSLRDLQAAIASRARPMLVLTGKGRQTVQDLEGFGDVPIYEDLSQAVNAILSEN
jgi:D-glycero-D-manno-heptose 1,7-bisphosphate phosphatase